MPPSRLRIIIAASLLAVGTAGVTVAWQSPLTGQISSECGDGIDNDGDGKVDGLANAATDPNATRTFGGQGWDVIYFLAVTIQAIGYRDGDAIDDDAATAKRICNLAGYSTVASVSGRNFSSCGDNWVSWWDPAQNQWIRPAGYNACSRQPYIGTLVCKGKVGACQDGIDNDGDGAVDMSDGGCASVTDASEVPHDPDCAAGTGYEKLRQCQDGIDNDGDGLTDYPTDIGCESAIEDDERSQCEDGRDNDNDGAIDHPTDFSCADAKDNDEANPKAQCQDGIDNDGDGAIDHPNDFSCASKQDNDEASPKSVCQDGIDNDGDGAIDLADFSCQGSLQRNDEASPKPQCDDGADNDGDGAIDLADFSCAQNKQANDEANPKAQCQDGTDNDNDGAVDIADFACASNQGNNEDAAKAQCQDGIDNDGDGAIDLADFSCQNNKQNNSEDTPKAACQDGKDNDGDGKTDTLDIGCLSKQDNDERADCEDDKDNDGDGLKDYPGDGGCSQKEDNDETNPPLSVDLKINGQDGPITVPSGTKVTLSWTSENVVRCDTGTSTMPEWQGTTSLPVSGSKQLTFKQSGTYGMQCAQTAISNMGAQDSVAVSVVTGQCNDGKDNDQDGVSDLADPGCTDLGDTSEDGEACKQSSILVLNLEPFPFSSGQPASVDELTALKLNVTYHTRLSLPSFTAAYLKQFDIIWLHNGCSTPTSLLSNAELQAFRDYYLDGGNLVLSPGDLTTSTTAASCTSRIAQIAANLGVTYAALESPKKAGCQNISSDFPLLNATARVYQDKSANLAVTPTVSWGATPAQLVETSAGPDIAYIPKEQGHGSVIVLSQLNMMKKQCTGTQPYRNMLGMFGFHTSCSCTVASSDEDASRVSTLAENTHPMETNRIRTLFVRLATLFSGTIPQGSSLTASATVTPTGFACGNGATPSVRTVQLAGAMGQRAYGGISIYDRSSTTITLLEGDKVFAGVPGQVHWSDDEIHIEARGTQIINYVVGGCSGNIDKTRTTPIDITGIFSGAGTHRVNAEFVDTCGSMIGHSAYTLSLVSCGNPPPPQSSAGASSTASVKSQASSAPNICRDLQQSCQLTQCNDGIDNDGDGKIDLQDDGCADSQDTTEQEWSLPLAGGSCTVVTLNRVTGSGNLVSVPCPSGYVAVGGGWNEYRYSDRGIDGSWPASDGKGWQCKGDAGAQYCFEQSCSAVCCAESAVQTAIVEKKGPLKDAPKVMCPADYTITGGGFNDATFGKDEEYLRPVGNNGWECLDDESTAQNSACYAVCTKLRSAEEIQCQTVSIEQMNGPPMRVTCPAGTIITGGGFHDTSTGNDDEESSGPYGNGWECWEDNSDSEKAPGICYARCCSIGSMETEQPPSPTDSCRIEQRRDIVPSQCEGTTQNGLCSGFWYQDITFPNGGFANPPHVIVTPRRVPANTGGCAKGATDFLLCRPQNISKTGFRLQCSGSPVKNACPGQDDWYSQAAADWTAIDKSAQCNALSGHDLKTSCTAPLGNGLCNEAFGATVTFQPAFAAVPRMLATPEFVSDQMDCVQQTTDTLVCSAGSVSANSAQVLCAGSPSVATCGADNGKYSKGTAGWLAMPSVSACRVEQGSATAVRCPGNLSGGTCSTPFEVTVPFSPAFGSAPTVIIAPSQVSKAPVCQGNATATDAIICEVTNVTASNFTARCSGSPTTDACGAGTNANYTSAEFSYLAIAPDCGEGTVGGSSSAAACVLSANRYANGIVSRSNVGEGLAESYVLGAPDKLSADFDSPDSFGYVTVKFAKAVKDIPGNDFVIHLNDFFGNEIIEAFDVIVTSGTKSFTLGTVAPQAVDPRQQVQLGFDISATGQQQVQAVTIRNANKGVSHIGPDIDALENLTDCQAGTLSSLSSSRTSSSRTSSSRSSVVSSRSSLSVSSSSSSSSSLPSSVSSSSVAQSSASSVSSTTPNACPADFCERGGSVFCAVTGRDCRSTDAAPCFACVERASSASSEVEFPAELRVGAECTSAADCPTNLCVDGRCAACRSDAECGAGYICLIHVCREDPLRPAAPLYGCGNGRIDGGEECDDGNVSNGDGCTSECLLENGVCGDGTIQSALGEQCEPGQASAGSFRCGPGCRLLAATTCGNGMPEPGEECDRGSANSDAPDADCRSNCTLGRCGDGIHDPKTEECDDGNRLSGDGCSGRCIDESGRGQTLHAGDTENPILNGTTSSAANFGHILGQDMGHGVALPYEQWTVIQQMPLGQTGPAAVGIAAAGAAFGFAWSRKKRSRRR